MQSWLTQQCLKPSASALVVCENASKSWPICHATFRDFLKFQGRQRKFLSITDFQPTGEAINLEKCGSKKIEKLKSK